MLKIKKYKKKLLKIFYQPINQQVQTQIVHWKHGNQRGYFYSNEKHYVGQTVMVDVGM